MLHRETLTVSPTQPSPKASVLCIDESPGMLLICRAILEANGYTVFTAANAVAGLEILERNLIDVAVIDDSLQDMSAMALVQAMRSLCRRLPVVVFTRSPAPDGGILPTEVYLHKGRGPKALLAAVNEICERITGFQA